MKTFSAQFKCDLYMCIALV